MLYQEHIVRTTVDVEDKSTTESTETVGATSVLADDWHWAELAREIGANLTTTDDELEANRIETFCERDCVCNTCIVYYVSVVTNSGEWWWNRTKVTSIEYNKQEGRSFTMAQHLGVKTLEKGPNKFSWVNLKDDVHDWCRICVFFTARDGQQQRLKEM